MEIKLKNLKMRFILPVFFGCLGSLAVCALLAVRQGGLLPHPETAVAEDVTETVPELFAEPEAAQFFAGDEPETTHFFAAAESERPDVIQEAFRCPETREQVIDFFEVICPSREIAEIILINADRYNIPPALAFALGWEESRLNPRAVNNQNLNGSTDRGLFQLNNRSFPQLDIQSFFSPTLNAMYGMSHLRYCLDTGGTEIAALAMYNAGTDRVRSSGTPKSTLDYASRILENRLKIESRFQEPVLTAMAEDTPVVEEFSETVAEVKPERSRLLPLKPLSGGR
jgi:soluble lytic murein transglycosylase-like protein